MVRERRYHYFALLPPNGAGITARAVGTRYGIYFEGDNDFSEMVHEMKGHSHILDHYRSTRNYGLGCTGCTIYHFEPCLCCGFIFLLPGKLHHLIVQSDLEVIECCDECPFESVNCDKILKEKEVPVQKPMTPQLEVASESSDELYEVDELHELGQIF